MENKDNKLVVKRNDLIRLGYSLTLNEQRLLLACISQVDSRNILDKGQEFEIHIQEIGDLFSNSVEKNLYRDIKKASETLFDRRIVSKDEDGNKTLLRWVWKIKYIDDTGVVKINFSPDITGFLSEITKNFTKYKLTEVTNFKCQYSIRIYELMSIWQSTGEVEYEVDDLRQMLDLGDKYKSFAEFRRNVLDKSINEINKYSSMDVSYGLRKRGRVVSAIQFNFKVEPKIKQKITIEDFVSANPVLTKGKTEWEESNTTLPTYEYPEPRYFLDYSISPEYGDEPPRWVRMPMMSSLNVQKIMRLVFTESGMYNFRVQLEEHLDEEVTDNDGKGLGYTRREHHFDSRYQKGHEVLFEELGFDGFSKENNREWDDVEMYPSDEDE